MFPRATVSLVLVVVFSGCGGTATEADDAGDGYWGKAHPQEDTEWERNWSAGHVGCSPDEIHVRNMKGWGGNKTWSAECQGRLYHCTSLHTYGSHAVSCTPSGGNAGSPAPGPVHQKQIEWATSALPSHAIGYTFGANLQATAESCLNAGNSWTKEKKQFRCSGLPLDVGLPGQSTAAFCAGRLCVVTAYLMLSKSDQAEQTLKIIANDLVKKYGDPTHQRRIKEPTCDDSFVACVESAEASWEAVWKWKTGEVLRATTMVKNKEAFVAIRYQLGEPDSTDAVNSNGDTPIDTSVF